MAKLLLNSMKISHIPLPPIILTISILIALIAHFTFPVMILLPFPYNLLGIGLIGVGIMLISWSYKLFKTYKTTIHPQDKPSCLIIIGPYKFSRNPIYLGMLLIALGSATFFSSLAAFIAPLLFIIVISKKVIPFEEKMLLQSFGDEYRKYKSRVGRWI